MREAVANDDLSIPPLHEDLATVAESLAEWDTYVVRVAGRLVGSVRGRLDGDVWDIGRLMVAPDQRGRGLGRLLLEHAQAVAPAGAASYRLFTGKGSADNLRMYKKAGFGVREVLDGPSGPAVLTKRITRR
ncbi:GNAT family N-acetyltransferase [Nocardioides marmotae]|uniref:GNAT family N-acetyltransferase n=1 Tax=Nocardioides marmotae TaxID=2663857 RepID=UPI00215117C5|nr:GNAT family N-acetyltransferase [Nocardioides marmotae]